MKTTETKDINTTVRDATPDEVEEWMESDFFMKGDFDVMKLFVVVPAIIQMTVFGMMLFMFVIINAVY
jgi:hypothetical protein